MFRRVLRSRQRRRPAWKRRFKPALTHLPQSGRPVIIANSSIAGHGCTCTSTASVTRHVDVPPIVDASPDYLGHGHWPFRFASRASRNPLGYRSRPSCARRTNPARARFERSGHSSVANAERRPRRLSTGYSDASATIRLPPMHHAAFGQLMPLMKARSVLPS